MSNDPAANREAVKKYYDNHKDVYREKNRKARKQKSEFIQSKKEFPCVDCGIQYPPYIMEFDHVEEKFLPVSRMTSHSWKQINAEIAKCEVVCANCHAVRTYLRRNLVPLV